MDIHRNLLFSGNLPTTQSIHNTLKAEYPPVSVQTPAIPGDCPGSLDEFLFNGRSERDIGLEWLSIYVEDCFSVTGNYLSGENPATASQLQKTAPAKPAEKTARNFQKPNLELVVPGKARTKRKRASNGWSHDQEPPLFQSGFDVDPPLLYQAHWLADSELLIQKPKENPTQAVVVGGEEMIGKGNSNSGSSEGSNGQPRRCSHCLTQKTPQWRAGPMGAKTLCNACGVRFKSGRLLPEYRPAKSPTFESFKHSNSHKKVMEMRSTIVSE